MPATSADPVLLHAAGSLRLALTDVIAAYEPLAGVQVQARFGASGTLKDAIANGERAHVFASANMAHPQALADAKKGGPVVLFARNPPVRAGPTWARGSRRRRCSIGCSILR